MSQAEDSTYPYIRYTNFLLFFSMLMVLKTKSFETNFIDGIVDKKTHQRETAYLHTWFLTMLIFRASLC